MAAISMVIGFVSLRHVDIQAAQGLSAVATRCCFIYNRGLKGDGQCWLSVRLLCRVVLGTAALSIGSRPKFQTSEAVLLYGGSPKPISGFRVLGSFVGGPQQGAMDGSNCPALPGFHDVPCCAQLGQLRLRIPVVSQHFGDVG